MNFVYILANRYNTVLYTGVTNNLERRVREHKNHRNNGFTSKYNINKLVYFECHEDIEQAIVREKYVKKLSRANKVALIEKDNPEWRDLSDFVQGDSLAPYGARNDG